MFLYGVVAFFPILLVGAGGRERGLVSGRANDTRSCRPAAPRRELRHLARRFPRWAPTGQQLALDDVLCWAAGPQLNDVLCWTLLGSEGVARGPWLD
jgi:hypothetical protein